MSDQVCPAFDCADCGRRMILVVGELRDPPRCSACLGLPGWFRDPRIRATNDPQHDGRGRDEPKVLR